MHDHDDMHDDMREANNAVFGSDVVFIHGSCIFIFNGSIPQPASHYTCSQCPEIWQLTHHIKTCHCEANGTEMVCISTYMQI